jgi:hypothetical protein
LFTALAVSIIALDGCPGRIEFNLVTEHILTKLRYIARQATRPFFESTVT